MSDRPSSQHPPIARSSDASVRVARDFLDEVAHDPWAWFAALGLLLIGLAVVGQHASQATLAEQDFQFGANHLQFAESDGMFMVGVVAENTRSPIWWSRRRSLQSVGGRLVVQADLPFAFTASGDGWGFGVQFYLIAIGAASMPLWWFFVHRGRWERQRRARDGLCRNCGYDLRMSSAHCPECGRYVGRLRTGKACNPSD